MGKSTPEHKYLRKSGMTLMNISRHPMTSKDIKLEMIFDTIMSRPEKPNDGKRLLESQRNLEKFHVLHKEQL